MAQTHYAAKEKTLLSVRPEENATEKPQLRAELIFGFLLPRTAHPGKEFSEFELVS